MFGSQPLELLELLWTKGERPEVEQHYLFCSVSYQLFKTAQQIKHRQDSWGLSVRCEEFQSFLQSAGGCPSSTEENSPTSPQPAEEGPATRQTAPSPEHCLCLFAVAQRGRKLGPQEVSHPSGSWVPLRVSPDEGFLLFKKDHKRKREREVLAQTLYI